MINAIALTGPTASGKTALSVALAKRLGCEIISCDSMQIYRGMDIGTAKVTEAEREGVPHHLIDLVSPDEAYSAMSYRACALECARDITSRGRLPFFVGGTGLYIDTLTRSGEGAPESSPEWCERILAEVGSDADALWARLNSVDPESAAKIHKNNMRRVLRAIEIYERTGRTKSSFDEMSKSAPQDISVGMITIDFHNRDLLYDRIDRRVDEMMSSGLLSEVGELISRGYLTPDTTAYQAIGYKELTDHIRFGGELSCAVDEIKLASRRYAKRQLTWFRHNSSAYRLFADGTDGRMRGAEELLSEAEEVFRQMISNF